VTVIAHTATPLARKLAARIAQDGPISVADYMQACLHDLEHGYYRRRMAIGGAGDFVTAPEISQVFGELIGLWCTVVWQQMGAPQAVRLIELGPGRGTLMRDALRASRLVPEFRAALSVDLIETNAALADIQRTTLGGEAVALGWSTGLEPGAAPAIVVANEFLDTLPVAQWAFRDGVWHRRCVGLDAAGDLNFVDGAPDTPSRCQTTSERPSTATSGSHGMPRWQGLPASSPRSALPLLHCSSTTATRTRASAIRCRRSASTATLTRCTSRARLTSPPRSTSPPSPT